MKRGDGRNISHEVLEAYRYRAIELYQKGKSVQEIAFFFGIHRGSVSLWIKIWKENGKFALKSRKALGPEPKLNKEDKTQIISWLRRPAMEFGFETPLWDCKRIQTTIKRELNKTISISNLWGNLRRWKLTPQKPEREALEKNPKAVKKWLNEEWPKIEKHRRRWQAMLYFQDESGVSLIPVLGKTWAPKGKPPIVKVTAKRGGLCVTSAISPAGKMIFRLEKKRVNADLHIEFLGQILKQHPNRKIIVIEDRAPPHRSYKVRKFVEEHKRRLAVYLLPSYSPELNPDEHVWGYLKAYKLKAHQAQNTDELRKLVKRKMQGIQRKKKVINSFFIGTYVL